MNLKYPKNPSREWPNIVLHSFCLVYKLLPKILCKYISSEDIDTFLRNREAYTNTKCNGA